MNPLQADIKFGNADQFIDPFICLYVLSWVHLISRAWEVLENGLAMAPLGIGSQFHNAFSTLIF